MAALFSYVYDVYTYCMDELSDPRVNDYPLMSSPWPTIGLLILYNYFVHNLGPELMKNRKPIEPKLLMIIYNILQISINGYLVIKALTKIWIPREYSLLCAEVDYSNNELPILISYYVWVYFISKILDLFDTIFMVIRKKQSQVTFLHVYHHTAMVAASWVGTKFIGGGHPIFFGTMNAFVHVIMYTYYLITVLNPEYKKNIWWKRHITELQLVQFVIALVHGLVGICNPNCNFPKILIAIFIPQDVFMFAMFWDFYRKAYITKKPNESKSSNGDGTSPSANKSD